MTPEDGAFLCQKGVFTGGRGAVSASKFAVMSEKGAWLVPGYLYWRNGVPHLLRMAL